MGFLRSLFSANDKVADANFLTLATFDATGQAANIASTLLYAVPANAPGNLYCVSGIATVTQAATTSSTLPSIVISYTDGDTGNAMSLTLTPTSTGNSLTTLASSSAAINAKPGTNVNVSTTGYASSGTSAMNYSAHVRLEAM